MQPEWYRIKIPQYNQVVPVIIVWQFHEYLDEQILQHFVNQVISLIVNRYWNLEKHLYYLLALLFHLLLVHLKHKQLIQLNLMHLDLELSQKIQYFYNFLNTSLQNTNLIFSPYQLLLHYLPDAHQGMKQKLLLFKYLNISLNDSFQIRSNREGIYLPHRIYRQNQDSLCRKKVKYDDVHQIEYSSNSYINKFIRLQVLNLFPQQIVNLIIIIIYKMASRYFDNRVHPHFTKLYSKVPYIDSDIFNIQTAALRESRRILNRTSRATEGIARTLQKSVHLENNLERSRVERDRADIEYLIRLDASKNESIIKGNESWRNYLQQKSGKRLRQTRQQEFLGERLRDSNRRAYERLDTVRRWL